LTFYIRNSILPLTNDLQRTPPRDLEQKNESELMSENIISLKAFKTLKECQRLYQGYKARLQEMEKTDLLIEVERYKQEASRYPNHLLTVVKGEILMATVKSRSLTEELKSYASNEEHRIKVELYKRLHDEWTTNNNRNAH